MPRSDAPRLEVGHLEAWRAWLAAHGETAGSLWLVHFKKGRACHVSYEDLRDEALCWGWVDSQSSTLDADRTMLWMARRKPGSGWSKINRDRVAELTAERRIQPPGLAAIERAKTDGSWHRLALADDPDNAPPDLAAALNNDLTRWRSLPRSLRRALLEQIALAKRPETRTRRVEAAAKVALKS